MREGSDLDGLNLARLMNSVQVAFWKFDHTGAVLEYEAWVDTIRLYASISNVQLTDAEAIQQLCGITQQLCTGPNTQYSSVEDCIGVLSRKPFGDADNLWADNVYCREVHIRLARVRPSVSVGKPSHVDSSTGRKIPDTLPTRRAYRRWEVCQCLLQFGLF